MRIFENKTKKARKQHRCCLCGELINKGENYLYQSGVDDNGFWKFKAHKECTKYIEDKEYPNGIDEEIFTDDLNDDCITYNINCPNKLDAVKLILQKKEQV